LLVAGCWLLVNFKDKAGGIRLNTKSYKDLEIYQLSYELAMKIHRISLLLPKYEQYEEASQIRKSSKGICSCVAEGYGRRRYKNEFIKFLVYAQASCDETEVHVSFIHDSGYINDQDHDSLKDEIDKLGRKINKFIQYVEKNWK
jgi:four helix bundle protein